MDYIKSWYDYFRGNMTGSHEKNAENVKDELLKLGNNSSQVVERNEMRENVNIGTISDVMRIFFGDPERHQNESRSPMENFWSFDHVFPSPDDMHKEFVSLVDELHSRFSDMQSFIFEGIDNEDLGNCANCEGPQSPESLRDYYLKVPPLASAPSDNNGYNVDIKIPSKNENATITSPVLSSFHQEQQMVSVAIGPNGVVEITKVTKDSTGKTEKTVTRMDLKDFKDQM